MAYIYDKDVEEAMKWVQTLEEKATPHGDLRALGEARFLAGWILLLTGDLRGAISRSQQAMELYTRIGDAKHRVWCLNAMGGAFLSLGDLQKAEEYACRGIENAKAVGSKYDLAFAHWLLGRISLSQGAGEKAVDALQTAVQLLREWRWRGGEAWAISTLGRGFLAQGDRVGALRRFQEALALAEPEGLRGYLLRPYLYLPQPRPFVASALSGLEAVYDDPLAFRAFCRRFQEEHPVEDSPFVQWFLEPAEPRQDFGLPILGFGWGVDDFENLKSKIENREPVWEDPFDDCSFTTHNGLEIHAANGRDLCFINLSAPRVLWPVDGDWAAGTVCCPASEERPAIGGLVLWKDKENYLRLDRGTIGEHEVFFGGCLGTRDIVIGRGRLPFEESASQQVSESASQRIGESSGGVFLRLERVGHRVNALCSADGERWFTVGHVVFPVEDPVQVGLHAIGNIDRTIYHGAYPDGTAIRFESFQLWGLNR
jgi:tetratricopeptide (TPR) repeat protein